jgi:hypothetical protein
MLRIKWKFDMFSWLRQTRIEEQMSLDDSRNIRILTLLSSLVLMLVFGMVAVIGSVSWILIA